MLLMKILWTYPSNGLQKIWQHLRSWQNEYFLIKVMMMCQSIIIKTTKLYKRKLGKALRVYGFCHGVKKC